MLLLFLVGMYVVFNLAIGVTFHVLSIIDIVAEPGRRELCVFFGVFAIAGIPILVVTLAIVALSFLFGGRNDDAPEAAGINYLYNKRSTSI